MLRRTVLQANKGPATPGPTLYGWGRTAQKRRLAYETVESKYHKKEFNKNWDVAGHQTRYTDYMEVRTYFAFTARWGLFVYNIVSNQILCTAGVGIVLYFMHKQVLWYDDRLRRAAWW